MEKLSAKKNKWQKPSLSLRDISPRGRDKFGLRVKAKNSLPLLGSPFGRAGICKQMTERAQITLSKHTQKEAPQTRSLFVLPRTILADVSFS